jgi:anti-anti-sigma regulatory factor
MSSDDKADATHRFSQCKGFRCPSCGQFVRCTNREHPTSPRCPNCQIVLWCTKRFEHGVTILDAIPRTKAEITDVAKVGESLQHSGNVGGVFVNLSAMDTVNSSFVAGLLMLRRLIETAGGSLVLCEVPPHVRAILERLKLHTLFVIKGPGQDSLSPT